MDMGRGHHRRQTVSAWRALQEQPEEPQLVPQATRAMKEPTWGQAEAVLYQLSPFTRT